MENTIYRYFHHRKGSTTRNLILEIFNQMPDAHFEVLFQIARNGGFIKGEGILKLQTKWAKHREAIDKKDPIYEGYDQNIVYIIMEDDNNKVVYAPANETIFSLQPLDCAGRLGIEYKGTLKEEFIQGKSFPADFIHAAIIGEFISQEEWEEIHYHQI